MKKLITTTALGMALAFATTASAQTLSVDDVTGAYLCTDIQGLEKTVNPENYGGDDAWLGNKMTVTTSGGELTIGNFVPMSGYYSCTFYAIPNGENTAYISSSRSHVYYYSDYITTSDENATDFDAGAVDTGADGKLDCVLTWSADRKTVTVENFVVCSKLDDSVMLKADKIVYQSVVVPNSPDVTNTFNIGTLSLDVTVTAPTISDYDSGNKPLDGVSMRLVLERSTDWGSTYTQVAEWTDVPAGESRTYPDTNVVPGSDTYYYYRATAYNDGAASNTGFASSRAYAPAPEVSNVSAEVDEEGVLIHFTLPTAEQLNGASLTQVEIRRNYSTIKTINDGLEPGKTLEVRDSTVEDGNQYKYQVFTHWAYGTSYGENQVTVFVGEDLPASVSNFKATVNGNNVTLTWDAPTEGRYGGEIDQSRVLYRIERQLYNDYSSSTTITPDGGISATSFVDMLDLTSPAEFNYHIYTYYEGKDECSAGTIYGVVCGPKNRVGFEETFNSKNAYDSRTPDNQWSTPDCWMSVSYIDYRTQWTNASGDWNYIPVEDHEGFAVYSPTEYSYWTYSYAYNYNYHANLTPYNFDFSDAKNPAILLDVFVSNVRSLGYIEVQAGEGNASLEELETVGTVYVRDEKIENDTDAAWREFGFSLSNVGGMDNVKLNLYSNSGAEMDYHATYAPIAFDNIRIIDVPAPVNVNVVTDQEAYTHTLTWDEPETEEYLADYFQVYRTATTTTVDADGNHAYIEPEQKYVLVATVEDTPWKYVDNMYNDGILDQTKHEYYVVAVYDQDLHGITAKSDLKKVDEAVTAIDTLIIPADGNARFYNLQGLPVENPVKGQTLIQIKNGKAVKVIF